MTTGIVKDKRYLKHDMGSFHVENPMRLEFIYRMLEEDYPHHLELITPRPAEEDEITLIHTPEYFRRVKDTSGKSSVILDPDTSTCPESFQTALLAAGGFIEAAEAVLKGKVENSFALIRPPGHHAEADRAMGFCIFNNAAIAAEFLLKKRGLERILIFDWDLHHGNGTQHSFWQRKDVLYFSIHQAPFYPGTGAAWEIGSAEGKGYTINIPLSPGKNDADYLYVIRNILGPVARHYRPDFIIASAGFDIYAGDPLGGMKVTESGFAAAAAELLQISRESAGGRLAIALEGGYNLEGLSRGVKEVLLQLGEKMPPPRIRNQISTSLQNELKSVREALDSIWMIPED